MLTNQGISNARPLHALPEPITGLYKITHLTSADATASAASCMSGTGTVTGRKRLSRIRVNTVASASGRLRVRPRRRPGGEGYEGLPAGSPYVARPVR